MTFIVRIELASNIFADFNLLHKEMETRGFSQVIRADDGNDYHLPKATYTAETSSNSSEVLTISKEAADKTGKTSEIFVADFTSWISSGLKMVNK